MSKNEKAYGYSNEFAAWPKRRKSPLPHQSLLANGALLSFFWEGVTGRGLHLDHHFLFSA